jgi:hypothetical protein
VGGYSALGVGAVSAAAAAWLTVSAHALSTSARNATTNQETVDLNQQLTTRRRWAGLSYGIAGTAAVTGGLLLLWPRDRVQPLGTFDGSAGTVGLAGGF